MPKRKPAPAIPPSPRPTRTPQKDAAPRPSWFVYLLRCANGSLYTGITTHVEKRLTVHNAGKGSAYVRAHRPATLVAYTEVANRSLASRLEYRVKALSQAQKLALAATWQQSLPALVRQPGKAKAAASPSRSPKPLRKVKSST